MIRAERRDAMVYRPFRPSRWTLTRQAFDRLLAFLDPDRAHAGNRYEEIRLRLINIFTCRGCSHPEELADETIDRVARKLPEIEHNYVGQPVLFFCGVARKVFLEWTRYRMVSPPPAAQIDEEIESAYRCLETCLETLPKSDRELIVEYYRGEKTARIAHRKELARREKITLRALRIRAFRIRKDLQARVLNRIERSESGFTPVRPDIEASALRDSIRARLYSGNRLT